MNFFSKRPSEPKLTSKDKTKDKTKDKSKDKVLPSEKNSNAKQTRVSRFMNFFSKRPSQPKSTSKGKSKDRYISGDKDFPYEKMLCVYKYDDHEFIKKKEVLILIERSSFTNIVQRLEDGTQYKVHASKILVFPPFHLKYPYYSDMKKYIPKNYFYNPYSQTYFYRKDGRNPDSENYIRVVNYWGNLYQEK